MRLTIHIPDEACKGCPLLRSETIDHNYYGETSVRHSCVLLNCTVDENNKPLCSEVEDSVRYAICRN